MPARALRRSPLLPPPQFRQTGIVAGDAARLCDCSRQAARHSADASQADLAYMLANRLTKYKDIYLDDAVSGTRTKRPAFDAMIAELKADPSISHLFVHKRDRLGRPRRRSR